MMGPDSAYTLMVSRLQIVPRRDKSKPPLVLFESVETAFGENISKAGSMKFGFIIVL
jgi:hypothetical protein